MTDQHISHYRILEKLAAGGMGVVYRAHDTTLGRTVALKLLPEELMGDSERRRRFLREARTAASLNHPGICTIYEVGEDQGRTFIAMELVPGVTLASKLANGPLPIPDLLRLALEIAEGLAEAHAHGITHRDLKPQNLMVMPNGHAKVLDFGLAKAAGPVPNDDTFPSSTLSREGLVVGTVPYLSPEQALGGSVDSRSDIFSFGTVLYEMAAGQRPFRGASVASVVAEILRAEPELLTILRPALPRDVARIISRCLQKKPEDRYNDTKRLVVELREAQSTLSPGTGVLRPAPSRRLLPWAGAGLLLVTAIAASYLHSPTSGSRQDASSPRLQVRTLTQTGATYRAAVTPDGRYVAYVNKDHGEYELRLLQVATTRDVPLIPRAPLLFRSLHFSPDGNFIYFLRQLRREDSEGMGVFRIATLGGPATLVASEARPHSVTVSPDGKQVAYIGRTPGESLIVAVGFDGSSPHVLARRPAGRYFWFVEWSPRLDTLAAVVDRDEGMELVRIELPSGAVHPLSGKGWGAIGQPAWSPDGSTIYAPSINDADPAADTKFEVWGFDARTGASRQLTSSPIPYMEWSLSASASGDLVGNTETPHLTLWVSNPSGVLELIPSAKDAGIDGVAWVNDRIVTGSIRALTVSEPDGRNASTVRAYSSSYRHPARCGPTHVVYGAFDAVRKSHIARTDILTGVTTPLTDGPYDGEPTCTTDGSTLIFSRCVPRESRCYLESRSLAAGQSLRLFAVEMGGDWFRPASPTVSWDGSKVLFRSHSKDPHAWAAIVPISGGPVELLPMPFSEGEVDFFRWAPRDQSILCLRKDEKGVENIWSVPLDGKNPKRLTSFEAEVIYAFDVSADNRLVLSHGSTLRDVVLIHP